MLVAQGARYLARSLHKALQKRISRAQRRRTNKRAATKDVATCNAKPDVTERNQIQAHILRLPLELRQQIYDLHFKQRRFFIHELYDRGVYKLSAPTELPSHIPYPRNPLGVYQPPRVVRELDGLLSLPLVCRQIYCETIEYLYRKNVFLFDNYNEALLLPSIAIFPQKHLDTLRSLGFKFCIDILVKNLGLGQGQAEPYYERGITSLTASLPGQSRQRRRWAAFWAFLAALPNLQRLSVTFTRLPGPGSPADELVFWEILAPLLKFNKRDRLAVFEVEWRRDKKPWHPTDGWRKSAPFEVVWIPDIMDSRRR